LRPATSPLRDDRGWHQRVAAPTGENRNDLTIAARTVPAFGRVPVTHGRHQRIKLSPHFSRGHLLTPAMTSPSNFGRQVAVEQTPQPETTCGPGDPFGTWLRFL
jgi:hypothetical protein